MSSHLWGSPETSTNGIPHWAPIERPILPTSGAVNAKTSISNSLDTRHGRARGGHPEMGVHQNRWFTMENESINRRFGGTPISGNLKMCIHVYTHASRSLCKSHYLWTSFLALHIGSSMLIMLAHLIPALRFPLPS